MLDKLRRKSRPDGTSPIPSIATAPLNPQLQPQCAGNDDKKQTITFFHLPAEIRNVIYQQVAKGILLRIPSPKERSSSTPTAKLPPIPPLLVVSRQIRNEYLPLLLSAATIRVVVRAFDFHSVARVCRSLYSTELKALRTNAHLWIELVGDKCTTDSLVALRRWLENRGRGLDRLPWNYRVVWGREKRVLGIPTSQAVEMANSYLARRKVLRQNLEMLGVLYARVGEVVGFELLAVIEAMRVELEGLSAGEVVK